MIELNKENMKKIMFLIVFTVLVLAGAMHINEVWKAICFMAGVSYPFVLGCALAFLLNMPMRFVERKLFGNLPEAKKKKLKKIQRPCSLLLSLIMVIAVVMVVILVVVPQLGTTIVELSKSISDFWPKVQEWVIRLFENNPQVEEWVIGIEMNWDQLIQQAIEFLKNGAGTLLGSTYSVALSVVNGVTNFVIAFVFGIYILLQKEKLSSQIQKVLYAFLPARRVEQIRKVCLLTNKTFSSFFAGQCVEAVLLGSMFVVSMVILNFPYALLVGVLIAFTALIPIFGAFIGCGVGAFLILMENPMQAVGFVVLFLVLQQIEGNLIYPHVVGGSVGLPSIWVLAAVSLGGSLMGIVGMLVFIPLVSVLYSLFRSYVYKRLQRQKERGSSHETIS